MFGTVDDNKHNWTIKCINQVCTLKSGNSEANNSSEGDLPYVKVGDMGLKGNERYITTSSQFVSRQENSKGIFPIGTTIFPKRGGAISTNKKRLTSVEICCDLNTMGVIPDTNIVHPVYIFQYFHGIDLGTLCNGATIPQLNNSDIGPLRIVLPPLEIQNIFAKQVESIERQSTMVQRSLYELEQLFNGRMDFYFN
jgi:type I restriction enzyme S subunit